MKMPGCLQFKSGKGNTNTTLVHFIINGDKDKKELNPTITYHIITLAFVKNNHFKDFKSQIQYNIHNRYLYDI